MRYADPHRCPDCGAALPQVPGGPRACPSCGLPLAGETAARLFSTLQTADRLVAELRASALVAVPATTAGAPVATAAGGAGGTEAAAAPDRPAVPDLLHPSDAGVRRGLSGASVPRLLLALGATCLLVAAVTFLAVAWSWLGVGGRTAVLVALTVVSGGLAGWLGRRGLRAAAEALTVVACGLLALDLAGARDAGWLGGLDESGMLLLVGVVVAGAALAVLAVTRRRPLVSPQVISALALGTAVVGLDGVTGRTAVAAAAGAVAFVGLGLFGRRLVTPVLPWTAAVGGALCWSVLAGTGLERALAHGSYREMLLGGHGWPLAAASVLLLTPPLLFPGARLRQPATTSAAALGTLTLLLPVFVGGTAAESSLSSAAVLVAWSAVQVLVPERGRLLPVAPMLVASVVPLAVTMLHEGALADHLLGPATYSASVGATTGRLLLADAYLLPLLVAALVVALVSLTRFAPRLGGPLATARDLAPVLVAVVLLSALLSLSAYDVPLALVVAALVLLSSVVALAPAAGIGRSGPALAAAGGSAAATVAVASASAALLLVALVPVLLGAGALALRAEEPVRRLLAEAVLPLAAGLAAWTAGELAGTPEEWRGLIVVAVVGGLAVARPRAALEASAAVAGAVSTALSFLASGGDLTVLAWHLTLAGVLVVASSLLHPDRRLLGWPGGLLLAAATWARLADLGVEEPEPYTLPSAVALLAVGLWHLRRNPGSATRTALAPGLLLGTVPSLLWVLGEDPFTIRSVLLGAACLGLVLVGLRLRWSSPLLVGAGVGALVVLRLVEPYAAELPPWVLIGAAGALLTVVGVTWEARLHDLRQAAGYLGRLR